MGTVEVLTQAVQLDEGERAHLRALAGGAASSVPSGKRVSEPLRHLVESPPRPAYVAWLRRAMLAWNAVAAEYFDQPRSRRAAGGCPGRRGPNRLAA